MFFIKKYFNLFLLACQYFIINKKIFYSFAKLSAVAVAGAGAVAIAVAVAGAGAGAVAGAGAGAGAGAVVINNIYCFHTGTSAIDNFAFSVIGIISMTSVSNTDSTATGNLQFFGSLVPSVAS